LKKIAIIGYRGKMGKALYEKIKDKYEVCGIDVQDSLDKAIDPDLVIDFSNGKNSRKTAIWCKNNRVPLIIGATGQTEKDMKIIKKCSNEIPILKAGNFSQGINIIKEFINYLKKYKIESVSIFEKHHKDKKDYPSGTAIELAETINNNLQIKSSVCAIRGGKEIGLHELSFYFEDEVIKISHQAFSRNAFISGVLESIEFILNITSPGLYRFEDIKKSMWNWIFCLSNHNKIWDNKSKEIRLCQKNQKLKILKFSI